MENEMKLSLEEEMRKLRLLKDVREDTDYLRLKDVLELLKKFDCKPTKARSLK